ncbi:hypothetical protein [Nonomuraea sp. NPDC046570]
MPVSNPFADRTPWYEDDPATCCTCDGVGTGCDFCGGEGIVPRWVYED